MEPLFSVVTVTFNAAAVIDRTIRSIEAQSCRDFEWIVVDGASSDATVRLARKADVPELSLSSEPDKGLYDAMNKGLARARGRYLVFLNAGDAFHSPDTLASVAAAIKANDEPGIVYGQTDIVDEEGTKVGERHLRAPKVLTLDSFKEGMVVCHQAFFVLRQLAQPYDLRYRFSADYEWCIRCLQRSRKNVYVDEVLVDYLSEGMTTRNHRASLMERFRIMSFYFGFWPTLFRHISFIPRYLSRR